MTWSAGTNERHPLHRVLPVLLSRSFLVPACADSGQAGTVTGPPIPGRTPIFGPGSVGEWHCVEAHVRLNEPGRSGGLFEPWVDGEMDARVSGLNWTGAYDEYGLNTLIVENYWNDGAPAEQERYIDDLVVSEERIGC